MSDESSVPLCNDPARHYTLEELSLKVQSEGLGYAVQYFLSANQIVDPQVRQLWHEAKIRLDEIEELLPDPETITI